MKYVLYSFVIVLLVVHQDIFNWDNAGLVGGWLPVGLAYHVGYTLVTAVMWVVAIRVAWPAGVEVPADE